MAQRITTVIVDDLTGVELGADGVTVSFALDGVSYEIDLAPATAAGMREALAPFVAVARRSGSTRPGRARSRNPVGEQAAARAWFVDQGIEVAPRGRLSAELLERYRAR